MPAVGCMQSKKASELVVQPNQSTTAKQRGSGAADEGVDGHGRLLPPGKVPPTPEEARNSDDAMRNPRLSIKYQSKEISGRLSTSRRSSTPFDRARIGTHTRHGLMPGPRGFSAAKINQDRGVVCWPFNGSYNQALLCVFDGHGSKGERASEFCMKTIPELLECVAIASPTLFQLLFEHALPLEGCALARTGMLALALPSGSSATSD